MLDVADHRQPEDALARVERLGHRVQVEPQVVGRGELVPVEVGERRLVGVEGLGALAEHDPAVGLARGEVSALAVGGGAAYGLDRERRAALGEPARDPGVRHGTEVVGVGDEDVLVAGVTQLAEHAGAAQRGVEVAVAGRTPLEVGVLGVGRRHQALGQQLGHLVLQELERQPVDLEVLVAGERGHRVGRRAERVHEDERQRGVVLLAEVQHLPGDDVEEAQAAAHAQQRLRAVHPHRRAEAAVELDHRGRADRLGGDLVAHLDVGQRLHVEGADRRFGDHPRLAVLQQAEVVRERIDGDGIDTGVLHLGARRLEPFATHAPIVG